MFGLGGLVGWFAFVCCIFVGFVWFGWLMFFGVFFVGGGFCF